MVTPMVESIPTAAIPIPYSPASLYPTKMAMHITRIGPTTLSMPTAIPVMMLVAAPVWEALAILLMGENEV